MRRASLVAIAVFFASCSFSAQFVFALQSSHYHFDEVDLGGGGFGQSSSTNFQAFDTTGDLAIGNSSSSNFQVESGSRTPHDPTLSFVVNSTGANFGSFTASGPTTTTATFTVSDYTSYGYVVQVLGNPPTNGGHTISAMGSTDISHPGTEQFGINLVANTSPSVGANPNNGSFGFGAAATNYNTANNFRYVNGETIAMAPKSSGSTVYTLSYLVNVTSLTPGGQYTSDQTIVVTGTY